MLVGDRILTPIAREQCQRRREAAACAVTADKNTGAILIRFSLYQRMYESTA